MVIKSENAENTYLNKAWLIDKYITKGLSSHKIAELAKVKTHITICKWLKFFNIKLRKCGTKKGNKLSKEHKKAISINMIGHKGVKHTFKTKLKISKKLVGMKLSTKTKLKISQSIRLEKHPNWLGGKSFEPYSSDFNKYKKQSIRILYNNTCVICNKSAKDVHHIDYNKLNSNAENLILLCISCHAKTNFNRIFWKEYFNKIKNKKILGISPQFNKLI